MVARSVSGWGRGVSLCVEAQGERNVLTCAGQTLHPRHSSQKVQSHDPQRLLPREQSSLNFLWTAITYCARMERRQPNLR